MTLNYDLKKIINITVVLYMLFLIWALLFKLNDPLSHILNLFVLSDLFLNIFLYKKNDTVL